MAAIGKSVDHTPSREALFAARERAALLSDCMVEAKRVANSVIAGWHGRRRRGMGENFWQFRPYSPGESIARIDWRRSARDNQLYIRDKEWEAAHTIWLWADLSPSMLFQSRMAPVSKENRALVLLLAMAEVLARSGERIGCPGVMEPIASRNGAEKLGMALFNMQKNNGAFEGLPEIKNLKGPGELILIGDFLEDPDRITARLDRLAASGLNGHVLEVADPAEDLFPYAGRTEFQDPETGERLLIGRAESLQALYQRAYLARRQSLGDYLRALGWSFTTHRTDGLASQALLALNAHLSGAPLTQNKAASSRQTGTEVRA